MKDSILSVFKHLLDMTRHPLQNYVKLKSLREENYHYFVKFYSINTISYCGLKGLLILKDMPIIFIYIQR